MLHQELNFWIEHSSYSRKCSNEMMFIRDQIASNACKINTIIPIFGFYEVFYGKDAFFFYVYVVFFDNFEEAPHFSLQSF